MEARQRRRGATTAAEATRVTATRRGTRMGTAMATKRRLVLAERDGDRQRESQKDIHTDPRVGFVLLARGVIWTFPRHPFRVGAPLRARKRCILNSLGAFALPPLIFALE